MKARDRGDLLGTLTASSLGKSETSGGDSCASAHVRSSVFVPFDLLSVNVRASQHAAAEKKSCFTTIDDRCLAPSNRQHSLDLPALLIVPRRSTPQNGS